MIEITRVHRKHTSALFMQSYLNIKPRPRESGKVFLGYQRKLYPFLAKTRLLLTLVECGNVFKLVTSLTEHRFRNPGLRQVATRGRLCSGLCQCWLVLDSKRALSLGRRHAGTLMESCSALHTLVCIGFSQVRLVCLSSC